MVDVTVVIALALLAGERASLARAAFVAAALVVAIAWRSLGPWRVAIAALAFLLGFARASSAITSFDRTREAARDALGPPSTCHATGAVASSPVRRGDGTSALFDLVDVDCEGRLLPPLRARLYGIPDDLARGDRVDVVAQLAPVQALRNPDVADPRPALARTGAVASGGASNVTVLQRAVGIRAWIDRARAYARRRIEASYPEAAAPLARALVLGEEDLAADDGDAFRRSGLAHLLAVSGTHLVVVVVGIVAALRALFVRLEPLAARVEVGRVAAALGIAIAFAYADFAGASGSAVRAAAMLAVVFAARALARRGAAVRALGLSGSILALVDPLAAFDVGFLLSIAATGGLLAISPRVASSLPAGLPRALRGSIAASVGASLACAPLLAPISPSLPLLGVLANLVAVPIGEAAALPICIFHTLLGWAPRAESGAAIVASGALLVVRWLARAASHPSWGAVPVPPPSDAEGVILAALATALLVAREGRALVTASLGVAALLVAELAAIRAGAPHEVRISVLDVGQGDASLVDLPDGRAMLVDGGGAVGSPVDVGTSVLLPVLRARRRSRVDVVVLSHPHPDHFLGLASALPRLDVGELWDTGQGEDEGAGATYAAMLASLRERGVPIMRPRDLCGVSRPFGGATVEVLAPCPGYVPFAGANDNSFVLRLDWRGRAALLVGDAEHGEEASLVARVGPRLRADFLKIGHHGSRTSSTPAFLDAVHPELAAISCGVRNRFGHPHPTTLATLAEHAIPFRRTDRGGAIVVSLADLRPP